MIRTPGSTYRLQLHKDFGFDDASAIADYLRDLGVTHVYSSPYLQAAPGSMHGYDVVDHRKVNEELGGTEAHLRFNQCLGENNLGQILDIVPNHMSLGEENRYWWDVLENGTSSRYASFFDIDWNSAEERLRNKVLVPILGDQYGRVLDAGGIKLVRLGSAFQVVVSEQHFPISPLSQQTILAGAEGYVQNDTLSFLAASYGRLPSPDMTARATIMARHRDKVVLNSLCARLCTDEPEVCTAIDKAVQVLNSDPDALDTFLNQQNYRLAYWKAADQQLGYRRFFDVNTLIGLRMEREYVFDETHALVLAWLEEGVLDGVRVDHPDGLRDPLQYFRRLREHAPQAWIVGEKILARDEFLREEWPIQGTSGYDFLNMVSGLFIDRGGLQKLGKAYCEFTGDSANFPGLAHEKKLNVEQEGLGSDINRLTDLFVKICESNRQQRDFTRAEIRRALREVAACFLVYRTYVIPDRNEITEEDRLLIAKATDKAKEIRSDIDGALYDFMRDVLTLVVPGVVESEFLLRFQQFTSPVMAKGVEDTAFYCYNRLISMNEVGGDPNFEGVSVQEFHEYNSRIQRTHPSTLLALSTHDTKRSDDVRARLQVLTEVPDEFAERVSVWADANKRFKNGEFPDKGTEWFLYQTLVGAWPITPDRLQAYITKAMREAKVKTSWTANNKAYEDALCSFVESVLTDPDFCGSIESFVNDIVLSGRVNSLAQTLMKHTAPGVPDLYQGAEIWDLSLVDPDNRRPVDYSLRRSMLRRMETMTVEEIVTEFDSGFPKLWVTHRMLRLRKAHPDWFGPEAAYVPLEVSGARNERALAYLRGDSVATIVPRQSHADMNVWRNMSVFLPDTKWMNVLTDEVIVGGIIQLDQLFKKFPVAVLVQSK